MDFTQRESIFSSHLQLFVTAKVPWDKLHLLFGNDLELRDIVAEIMELRARFLSALQTGSGLHLSSMKMVVESTPPGAPWYALIRQQLSEMEAALVAERGQAWTSPFRLSRSFPVSLLCFMVAWERVRDSRVPCFSSAVVSAVYISYCLHL